MWKDNAMIDVICRAENTPGIEGYTSRELRRMVREHVGLELPPALPPDAAELATEAPAPDAIVVGTADNNRVLAQLLRDGFLPPPEHPQGYSMRCGPHPGDERRRILAIAGTDAAGALYALRDLEHYHMECLRRDHGDLDMQAFIRRDYPRIEFRGHWTWGCNMPDKKAWIENMSRWKLNELIHWDNYLPERAKEYVDAAHECGVRVVWGFGWGWIPKWNFDLGPQFDHGQGDRVEMCPSSAFNLAFFRREILRKIREDYAPTGCDGIYFQSFTEAPKCQCPRCREKTMGELMLNFVNPIIDDVKAEFPDLWISCGIHHDLGDYAHLKELDPRCNIYWENCVSGTSVRGEGEDFGYIHKGIHYGHGFSKDCPADPPYTEASLAEWMASNERHYAVPGGRDNHYLYMTFLQRWAGRFLAKRSANKHGCLVADHSVFCRRTPFQLVALAEAQWNPDLPTKHTVDRLLTHLGMDAAVDQAPEAEAPLLDGGGAPPWVARAARAAVPREGHDA